MPEGYRHLTQDLRCQIEALKKRGISQVAIAQDLKVDPSTISRELKRNRSQRGYRAGFAEQFAKARRLQAMRTRLLKITGDVQTQIESWLTEQQWSPEEIRSKLFSEFAISVSHELMYQHIWCNKKAGGTLYLHLRRKGKKYQKRSSKYAGRGYIPGRVDIAERPASVAEKQEVGNWEIDLIEGGKGDAFLLTLVERRTQLTLIQWLPNKEADGTTEAILKALAPYRGWVQTITSDNGKEFSGHQKVTESLHAGFYFATPYHSWERGLNERTNGLIRQYFPKGSRFATLTKENVSNVQDLLNTRPRKTLHYRSPLETFFHLTTNTPQHIALRT
jgi:IS30 family transposase